MNNTMVSVEGLSKSYASYRTEAHRVLSWFGLGVGRHENYVLRDVNLELREGEAVGVIGENGAGKSTLLKLLTGVIAPTEGSVHVNGKLSAILELGLGFNPEFTGRENVRLAGGLMGFSPNELDELTPEIEAFIEIGKYFDLPLRTYSSGMSARLAFGLATAQRPQLLIVDEVLSVGDSYFQHKSYDRIREFREQGTSIVLVTHSLGDVKVICDRAILMESGRVVKEGLPDEIVDYYNAFIAEKERSKLTIQQVRSESGWLTTESGDRSAVVESIALIDPETSEELQVVKVGQIVEFVFKVRVNHPLPRLVMGHRITTPSGHIVWGTNTWHTNQVLNDLQADAEVTYRLRFKCQLGPGSYAVSFGAVSSDTHLENCFHKKENALVFEVVNVGRPFFIGSSCLDMSIGIEVEGSNS